MTAAILVFSLSCWLAWDYASTKERNGQLQGDIAAWKSKHDIAIQAQTEAERGKKELQQEKEALDASLLDWKEKYDSINQLHSTSQSKLRSLGAENREMRDFLASPVPDDIWRVFFPHHSATNTGSDQN